MRIRKNPVTFTFERISSLNYNVDVLDVHEERSTVRDYSKIPINGRNGELIQDFGRYENITLVITCVIIGESVKNFHMLQAEFLALTGYHRLEHSYEPDYYRMAAFKGEVKPRVSRSADKIMFDLEFDCKPQRFLKVGEQAILFNDSSIVPQTQYAYSDFNSSSKSQLDTLASRIGVSASDFSYYVISPTDLPTSDEDFIRVEGDFEAFFVLLTHGDPLSDPITTSGRVYKEFKVYQYQGGQYFTFPVAANIKVYVNDVLTYQSENVEHSILVNPTMYSATPMVRLTIDRNTTPIVSDYLFSLNSKGVWANIPHQLPYNEEFAITIDCETMNAYSLPKDNYIGTRLSMNQYVKFDEQPVLVRGENDVTYNSLIKNLELTPRWWTL